MQVQPDPVQSLCPRRGSKPVAARADRGPFAQRLCQDAGIGDHHAQDAGRRHRRGLRTTGRRSAGPHAGAASGNRGIAVVADRFGVPLNAGQMTHAANGVRPCWRACWRRARPRRSPRAAARWWPRGRSGSWRPRTRRTPAAPRPRCAPTWPGRYLPHGASTGGGARRRRNQRGGHRSRLRGQAHGLLGLIYMEMN